MAEIIRRFHATEVPVGTLSPRYIAVDDDLRPFLLGPRIAPRSGAFVPPETASERRIDLRSDIYSLGRLLYFVVAGEEPPRESSDVPMLEELGRYPAGIVRIIRKATCRSPDDRYQILDEMLEDLDRYREHAGVGMLHPEIEDRNTGILSVVPDAPPEPETPVKVTEIPSSPTKTVEATAPVKNPVKAGTLFRAASLALAVAGVAFLVTDYMDAQGALVPMSPARAGELSSFVREVSMSRDRPPVLFVQVDDSWELLSDESRQQEAESLFDAAKARWGTRDGFLHRGGTMVAKCWGGDVIVFGSLHGDE